MSANPQVEPLAPPERRPLRVVKPEERKPNMSVKVELVKIRRELLTLATRIEKVTQGQD